MLRYLFDLAELKTEHSGVEVNWREEFINDLLSKLDIRFVHSNSIKLSGKYFEGWHLVLVFTEGSYGSMLLINNGVVIPYMT